MDGQAAQFRESVREWNPGKVTGRRRFSEAQRGEAVSYLDRRRREGASVSLIAEELGVGKTTLERWRSRRSRFVRVEPLPEAAMDLSMVSPGGYRIEGLSVDQAVDLLSRLG